MKKYYNKKGLEG